MARRQLQIAGTERAEHPEIEEAADAWRDARKESKAAAEKAKQKRFELIALMESRKVERYKYTEEESGEEILLTVEQEPKVRAKKTGDAESEIGEGLDGDVEPAPFTPGSDVPQGLIDQAERAMAGSSVEVDGEGDVVVPEKSAPRDKKRGGSSKSKAAAASTKARSKKR